jgi:hypothetical protein
MSVVEKLQRFGACVHIAHHLPGRIRLRLAPLDEAPALDADERSLLDQAQSFRELLDSIPGIVSIRVNLLARSCTVEYDRAVIPFQAWPDFLGGVRSEEAGILTRIIEQKYTEVANA